MEKARACGWLGLEENIRGVVWAGGNAATTRCPKSAIRGESAAWVEMYAAGQWAGMRGVWELESRDAEAMTVLAQEAERMRDEESRR